MYLNITWRPNTRGKEYCLHKILKLLIKGSPLKTTDFLPKLVENLLHIDPSSRSSSKLEPTRKMFAKEFGIDVSKVVCKFLMDRKNHGNRIAEACRQAPELLVLFLSDKPPENFESIIERKVYIEPPPVVMVLYKSRERWKSAYVWTAFKGFLPHRLSSIFDCRIKRAEAYQDSLPAKGSPQPKATIDEAILAKIVDFLGNQSFSARQSSKYSELQEMLEKRLGFPKGNIICKAISRSGAIGNRLGEAISLKPRLIFLFATEDLRHKTEHVTMENFVKKGLLKCPILFGITDRTQIRIVPVEASLQPADAARWRKVLNPPDSWKRWSYEVWNEKLLRHCLGIHEGGTSAPVERLPVSPEELLHIVGDPNADSTEVTVAFVSQVTGELPPGKSFGRFCFDYSGNNLRSRRKWSTKSNAYPHFFGMLWFTCLVASGYPDTEGGFHDRIKRLLKKNQIRCLNELWEELEGWTRQEHCGKRGIRPLQLPDLDSFRSNISHSYFLAFPHASDRETLSKLLVDNNLIGFEPPLDLVIELTRDAEKKFRKDFRKDLDNFIKRCHDKADPQKNAFWRAIRQEALNPSYSGSDRIVKGTIQRNLLAWFEVDTLIPVIGTSSKWNIPDGYLFQELDDPIGEFRYYVTNGEDDLDSIARHVLKGHSHLMGLGVRSLIKQGILIFQEQSHAWVLATGADINGADLALVRADRLAPFKDAFDGREETAIVDGWFQVEDCNTRLLDSLPPGLQGAHQLLRTMYSPTIRLNGGVRCGNGFLSLPGLLPKVRAPGASIVQIKIGDKYIDCRMENSEIGDWVFTREELLPVDALVHVRAKWEYEQGGQQVSRFSEQDFRIWSSHSKIDFKPTPKGFFIKEHCCPASLPIEGSQSIPLLITSTDPLKSPDLIELDPSARFLGPGLGEMSLHPRSGYDWFTVGPKNNPELLLFVGDHDHPAQPAKRYSESKGDKRHWKKAFQAPRVEVRTKDGRYHPISSFPNLEKMCKAYQRHRVKKKGGKCASTNLEENPATLPGRVTPAGSAWRLVDALAALSNRKSGLSYKNVQEIIKTVTHSPDFLLHQHLIRAFEETAALDLIRKENRNSTVLNARKPVFICSRRGPSTEATLMGLVPKVRYLEVRRNAMQQEVEVYESEPGNIWQTPLLRLRSSFDLIKKISFQCGLPDPQWVNWNPDQECKHLNMDILDQSLEDKPLGPFFNHDANWSWEESMFRRGPALKPTEKHPVTLSRWTAPGNCPFYVVTDKKGPWVKTQIRNWALLAAYELRESNPFKIDSDGWISSSGRSPAHLPLPVARLCSAIGVGVPGPLIETKSFRVNAYCYPFGKRLTRLVGSLIPKGWIK